MVSINQMPSELQPQGFFPDVQLPAPAPAVEQGGASQAAQAQDAKTQANPLTRADAEALVKSMNMVLQGINNRLQFGLYGETEQFYVRVIDNQSNSTIKVLPSEKLLDLRERIHHMVGVLVDETG